MIKILQKVMAKKVDYDIARIKEDAKVNNRDVDWIIRCSYGCGVRISYKATCIEHAWLCLKITCGLLGAIYAVDVIERVVIGCRKTQDAGNQKV